MKELKTLKDFAVYCNEERVGIYDNSISIKDLRQEAIKWMKEIQSFKKIPEDIVWEKLTGKKIVYSEEAKAGMINFIKHFFNITEEELK